MNKVYFPSLNGIRFIAALLVIVHHIELTKNWLGLKNYWANPSILLIGKLGVILFFVLSGFLITYLLLAEEKETKTISIKSFYIRRILRIWPLYYLLVALAFFVLSKIPFLHGAGLPTLLPGNLYVKLALFLFFLPNLALVYFPPVPFLSQAWSVGVEEQFYLIWPVLMKKVKNKERLLYGIVIGFLFIKIIGFKIFERYIFWNDNMELIKSFVGDFSIDCMAIGGIFALYLFRNAGVLNILFNKYLQWITIIGLLCLMILGVHIPLLHYEFYATLFGIVIINLAGNPNTVINFENKPLHYLGKISYGLYMYHPLVVVAVIKGLDWMGTKNFALQYLLSILLTIAVAGISYQFFERYFIRMKVRFSKIVSGDNVLPTDIEEPPPPVVPEYSR